jgi:DNA-binding transcriptional ArsR family regulator
MVNMEDLMAEAIRQVDDVDTLKALADPLRLAIMRCLMRDARAAMTVKEIAQRLEQGPTRLYRHIKLLEKVGLIEVVSSRIISGAYEHRYRVAQRVIRVSRDLLMDPANAGELAEVFSVTMDEFRGRLLRDIMKGGFDQEAAERGTPTPLVIAFDNQLSATRALEFRSRLEELVKEFNEPDDGPVIPVEFLLMYWSPPDADAGV